jgi:hypothetical protein
VLELQAELDTIFKTFPDLQSGTPRAKSAAAPAAAVKATKKAPKRAWSASDRKAVSERMKKYWAARRAKGAKKA